MTPDTYAVILNGVVVNTILALASDPFPSGFQYAVITGTSVGVGWTATTTDNINFTFTPPGGANGT